MLEEKGMKPTSHSSRITSTVCCAVNVVFSTEFINDFMTVNDRKSRQDHETRNTNKAFWVRAALAHNSINEITKTRQPPSTNLVDISMGILKINNKDEKSDSNSTSDDVDNNNDNDDPDYDSFITVEDAFSELIFPSGDVYLTDLSSSDEINLLEVDQFTTDAFRKKILDLFKIRRKIKENMNVSGTHDNEVWNFVESGMKGYDTGFTKIAVYYFYVRCDQTLGIDSVFQPFLDPSLRSDSSSLGWIEDDEKSVGHKPKRGNRKQHLIPYYKI
jgi:hypothetical protein